MENYCNNKNFAVRKNIEYLVRKNSQAFFLTLLPFLYRAGIQGFLSGAVASLLLAGMYYYGTILYPDLQALNTPYLPHVILILILFGTLLGLLSSLLTIGKYLKMSLDELY